MFRPAARVVAGLALAFAAASAHAQTITCYVVIDRNDNVIYRSTTPPVDMSERGAAAREAMRRRGELLMFVDYDKCPALEFITGAAGTVNIDLTGSMMPSALPTKASPAPGGKP